MAFKVRGQQKAPSDLLAILNDTKTQSTNPPLYQTLAGLINLATNFKDSLSKTFLADGKLDAGQISGRLAFANGGSLSGIYLPTLTIVANIDVVAPFYCYWTRVGQLVSVWGKCTIDVTAANVLTDLRVSLPFPSQFSHEEQCSGTANGVPFAGSTSDIAGIVIADVPNHEAIIRFYSPNTSDNDVRFFFSYLFIPLNL